VQDRPIEIEGLTVVVIGSFNPAIFHPSWLAMNNLVRKEEADEAKVDIITRDVSAFTMNWFNVQVIDQRLSLMTTDPAKHSPLRDLAVGIFSILEHTPIQAFGLNRDRHIKMIDEHEWHAFGNFFAPKDPWSDILKKPGMRTLVVEGSRDGGASDAVAVKIEPSLRVTPHGLYVNVQQHYTVTAGTTAEAATGSAGRFCTAINSAWADFLSFSDDVTLRLFQKFDESKR